MQLLTKSWRKVRNWAEVDRKNLVAAAVAFRRSVFAVVKRLLRRRNDGTGPAGALTLGGRGFGGGRAILSRTAVDEGQVVDDIYEEATRWLSPIGDNDDAEAATVPSVRSTTTVSPVRSSGSP